MENISQIIKKRNKRISKTNGRPVAGCNCRDKSKCPMNGNCKVENVVSICIASTTKISLEHVKFVLLKVITITSCHSEIRNTKKINKKILKLTILSGVICI